MPEMQKRDGRGEAESYTESGEEETKGGEEMNREEQIAFVVDFLETAYTGARAMDDVEIAARLERAIAVMKTPAEIDVFRPDFEEIYIEREVLKELEVEEMQKINREDVVQAALIVERWCKEHIRYDKPCDCPFYTKDNIDLCMIELTGSAADWELDKHLRARGLKHGEV